MNKLGKTKEMVSSKYKNKVPSCSTPEHQGDSPSRDSDSICDSQGGSPVPFICTQDGAEGEVDVVWNFNTPKSHKTATSHDRTSTPVSRKSKRSFRPKLIDKPVAKKRAIKSSQKNNELFQELMKINKDVNKLLTKTQKSALDKPQSGSEDDIFNESLDCSPKCVPKSNFRCLRKNVLSSNFGKPDTETALESDDSMNDCLLQETQMVEEHLFRHDPVPSKRLKYENHRQFGSPKLNLKIEQDSLSRLPISKATKSPCMNNDSLDRILGNLNDSALEELTQKPILNEFSTSRKLSLKQVTNKVASVNHIHSPLQTGFGRHKSMPESPLNNKPSCSGMVLKRSDTEIDLEFDDSLNECLLQASQIVEQQFAHSHPVSAKQQRHGNHIKSDVNLKMDQDSMDAILSNIKLEPASINNIQDNFDDDFKDSSFNQMPIKTELSKSFSRHNSMPGSPSVSESNKPSTSGMAFGRFSSMPYKSDQQIKEPGDSPIRCTPDEIKKKHQQAREKLLAKRLLPFTSTHQTGIVPTQPTAITQQTISKKGLFQPKVPISASLKQNILVNNNNVTKETSNNPTDISKLIEKKKQEAIMKLKRRQQLNK